MGAHARRVTCGASAVKIAGKGTIAVIRNRDATNDVSLGGSGVVAGAGFRVLHTDTLATTVNCGADDLYAVAEAGAPVIDVLVMRAVN